MFDDKLLQEVLHPDSPDHRANGKFAKGNQAGKGHGRPPKVREAEVLDAINSAMPKERITELLNEMIDIARLQKSWRGIASALDFCAAYQIGKPIARVEQGSGGIRSVMAELGIEIDEEETI
jgi:hypothetical protein